MANLTASQLLKMVAKANRGIMGEAEMRTYQQSLLGLLFGSQNDVFSQIRAMKQADKQPQTAILFNRVYEASGTAKEHDHAATAFPDSFEKTITFVRRQQTFKVSYKQADNNQFGYQEILNHALRNAVLNLIEDLGTYAVSWIDTNRSQVGTDSIIDFDETTNDRFDNAFADIDDYYYNLRAAMRMNKYYGILDVVGGQRAAKLYRKTAAQGASNSVNEQYQIPFLDFREEEQVTEAGAGTAYAWKKGMVGMMTWNEPINRRGEGEPGSNEGMFTTLVDPIFGQTHDLHVKRSIADTSGSAGHEQDVVDEYELTSIFTIQGAYLSTANETPIFKFEQAAS